MATRASATTATSGRVAGRRASIGSGRCQGAAAGVDFDCGSSANGLAKDMRRREFERRLAGESWATRDGSGDGGRVDETVDGGGAHDGSERGGGGSGSGSHVGRSGSGRAVGGMMMGGCSDGAE